MRMVFSDNIIGVTSGLDVHLEDDGPGLCDGEQVKYEVVYSDSDGEIV